MQGKMGEFRESAVGMMENIQESVDASERFWNNAAQDMRSEVASSAEKMRERRQQLSDKVSEKVQSSPDARA